MATAYAQWRIQKILRVGKKMSASRRYSIDCRFSKSFRLPIAAGNTVSGRLKI